MQGVLLGYLGAQGVRWCDATGWRSGRLGCDLGTGWQGKGQTHSMAWQRGEACYLCLFPTWVCTGRHWRRREGGRGRVCRGTTTWGRGGADGRCLVASWRFIRGKRRGRNLGKIASGCPPSWIQPQSIKGEG
jgi:hypothetical protein